MRVDKILPVALQRLTTVQVDAGLVAAAERLCETNKALLVVCDAAGVMRGVISKTDVVRQVSHPRPDLAALKAADVMTTTVTSCKPGDLLHDVLAMMKDKGFVHVPVVDRNARPIGVVNARDALQVLFGELKDEELLLREYVMGIGYR
jgi:CBS domain-containing protein